VDPIGKLNQLMQFRLAWLRQGDPAAAMNKGLATLRVLILSIAATPAWKTASVCMQTDKRRPHVRAPLSTSGFHGIKSDDSRHYASLTRNAPDDQVRLLAFRKRQQASPTRFGG